ncbi:MAG: tripartite tricarboxylate transporter substrate binding protein [Treponema sp.]|nr:tripartite tricarboxylate transporter substrate binding protein [Treponema sp.]
MKLKNLFSLFVILLVVVSMVSCDEGGGVVAVGEVPEPPPGFPVRPITIIVPQSAGGGTDIGVRLLARFAQAYVPQPIIIQNMPGGSTIVGITEAMRRPADGHTLIQFATATVLATAIGGQFDVLEDFDFVSLQVSDPRVLGFSPQDGRFSTPDEFLQFVRDNPRALTLGVTGLHNASHISALVFMRDSGLEFEIVNFDGQATMRPAFLGRHIDTVWQSVGETTPMLAGERQIVPVAVFSEERFEDDLPGVPTAREIGVDLVSSSYRGFAFRRGVDRAIVDYMARVFELVSQHPDYIQEMINLGLPNTFLGPEDYTGLVRQEVESYAVVVRELGLVN